MYMDENRKQFNVKLSKAEKSALRILAALDDLSMGDHIRAVAIVELWNEHFPGVPLGQDPSKQYRNGKEKTK